MVAKLQLPSLDIENFFKKGYFPKELPPNFNAIQYADNLENLAALNQDKILDKYDTKPIILNVPKSSNRRRNLNIPNPHSYFKGVKIVLDNLDEFRDKNSKINSFQNPLTDLENNIINSVYDPNLAPKLSNDEVAFLESKGLSYRLKTDIARFFPSIYTHSIPWIFRGKRHGKLMKRDNHWANKLDEALRNMQGQETTGILIGPTLFAIVAESLNNKIDIEITEAFNIEFGKNFWSGSRYVDDMIFYLSTDNKCKKALQIVSTILEKYKLEINSTKTEIETAPFIFEQHWKSEIKSNEPSDLNNVKELLNYLNICLYWAKKKKNEVSNPLLYGLKVLENNKQKDFWNNIKPFILQSIFVEPNCIPSCTKILINNKSNLSAEDKNHIKEMLYFKILDEAGLQHDYEVLWYFYTLISLDIKFEKDLLEKILNFKRPLIVLAVFTAIKSKNVKEKIKFPEHVLDEIESKDSFVNEWWLCAYEFYKDDFLALNFKRVPKLFFEMKKHKISFINNNS